MFVASFTMDLHFSLLGMLLMSSYASRRLFLMVMVKLELFSSLTASCLIWFGVPGFPFVVPCCQRMIGPWCLEQFPLVLLRAVCRPGCLHTCQGEIVTVLVGCAGMSPGFWHHFVRCLGFPIRMLPLVVRIIKHSQILYDVKGFRSRLPYSPAPVHRFPSCLYFWQYVEFVGIFPGQS